MIASNISQVDQVDLPPQTGKDTAAFIASFENLKKMTGRDSFDFDEVMRGANK